MMITAHKKTPGALTVRRSAKSNTHPLTSLLSGEVTTLRYYANSASTYSVCPRCRMDLEREYQNYCESCGQKLSWSRFRAGCLIEAHVLGPGQTEYRRKVFLHARIAGTDSRQEAAGASAPAFDPTASGTEIPSPVGQCRKMI